MIEYDYQFLELIYFETSFEQFEFIELTLYHFQLKTIRCLTDFHSNILRTENFDDFPRENKFQ